MQRGPDREADFGQQSRRRPGRGGFADLERLPSVTQFNFSGQYSFQIAGLGTLSSRVALLNLLDRVNLIRPAEGIGIFQSAYGPRFTIFGSISLHF